MISTNYTERYLLLNQLAYAIVAFPIGTVLSVAPLFLYEQKRVPLSRIGWAMACGELVGIIAMKVAELSKDGFLLKRPHDLHLIIICVATFLALITVWPESLWYMSCIPMILVQTFNSASKPVVGESMYRLSHLLDKDPIGIFAKANTMRRVGNAVIGALTPLMYAANSVSPFYSVGGGMLLFLVLLLYSLRKIQGEFTTLAYTQEKAKNENEVTIDDGKPNTTPPLRIIERTDTGSKALMNNEDQEDVNHDRELFRTMRNSACQTTIVSLLKSFRRRENDDLSLSSSDDELSRADEEAAEGDKPNTNHEDVSPPPISSIRIGTDDMLLPDDSAKEDEESNVPVWIYFLIVYAYPIYGMPPVSV